MTRKERKRLVHKHWDWIVATAAKESEAFKAGTRGQPCLLCGAERTGVAALIDGETGIGTHFSACDTCLLLGPEVIEQHVRAAATAGETVSPMLGVKMVTVRAAN